MSGNPGRSGRVFFHAWLALEWQTGHGCKFPRSKEKEPCRDPLFPEGAGVEEADIKEPSKKEKEKGEGEGERKRIVRSQQLKLGTEPEIPCMSQVSGRPHSLKGLKFPNLLPGFHLARRRNDCGNTKVGSFAGKMVAWSVFVLTHPQNHQALCRMISSTLKLRRRMIAPVAQ